MKKFTYFESTEGGMDMIEGIINDGPGDLATLRGWMSPTCVRDDIELLDWMKVAEVGNCTAIASVPWSV
jgi:hypothetical protein